MLNYIIVNLMINKEFTMSVYLIDYENVHTNGLLGLDNKTKNDTIIIFYSSSSNTLSFSLHRQLSAAEAKIEYIEVTSGGKNALDFQLSSYLGYLIAQNPQNEYVIITKDNGYNVIKDFWKKRGIHLSIAYNLSMESEKAMIKKLNEVIPQYKEDVSTVLSYIEKYKTKQGINNALVKTFGSDKAGIVYKAIKPFLADKQGR
ncbi:MAG: PIN domain-containing protein [Firmicutes bacterium]|nr:PIN domain-containing protein [Bacillota bacterium]